MLNVRQIIKEAMEKNPVGLKESLEEELRSRVALALEAKMTELDDEDLDEAAQPKWKATFKSRHSARTVSARNTAEAIKKATVSASNSDEDSSSPIYDNVERLKEDLDEIFE